MDLDSCAHSTASSEFSVHLKVEGIRAGTGTFFKGILEYRARGNFIRIGKTIDAHYALMDLTTGQFFLEK